MNDDDGARRRMVGRLLSRVGLGELTAPDERGWKAFLDALASLLDGLEQDRYLLERSLDVSSEEMMSLYDDLRSVAVELAAEREGLRATNAALAATLESTADGILVVDTDGHITTFNQRFLDMWNLSESALRHGADEPLASVADQTLDPEAFVARLCALYAEPQSPSSEAIELRDGRAFERSSYPQRVDGRTVGRVWSFRNITEERRLQAELQRMAFHDSLTGLATRAVFDSRVELALSRQRRSGGAVTVAVVDLDGFKRVNDSLGHQAGDALLIALAERFRSSLRDVDTVARLGGDEFAVVVDGAESVEQLHRLGARLLELLREPVTLDDREIVVGGSIGIAQVAEPEVTANDLLGRADMAMYRAKRNGKGGYAIFEAALHEEVAERLDLEQALRAATARGAIAVHYQPIVEAGTGRVVALEALARWRHPSRGDVPPDLFIPLAEESRLIVDIGRAVLADACRRAAMWRGRFPEQPLEISVNVSARQIEDPTFVRTVEGRLLQAGLAPELLTVEVTESALVNESRQVISTLRRLRDMGVKVAVDDFGTGYSSLASLSELPVDVLKIDKRFVEGLLLGPRGLGVVKTILALAHTFGLTATAEGVEEAAQLHALTALGCDRVQGFLFARPMPADEATAFIARGRAAAA